MNTLSICQVRLAMMTYLCLAGTAPAKIIYVNRNATGANTGTSWADARITLQAAMTSSSSGDQVWIAAGTYRPNDNSPGNLNKLQAFQLKDGVAVYGGFAGSETSLAQRASPANPVILSGDLLGDDSAANITGKSSAATTTDNVYNVFKHTGLNSTAVLDSVTLRGGNATGSGGAMSNSFSSPTLINCTIIDNSAGSHGGALYNTSSSPTLIGCTLSYNSATGQGGAILNSSTSSGISTTSSPRLINCTLTNNSAAFGGAIMNSKSALTLINCTVAYNSSSVVTTGNASGSGIRSVISSDKSAQSYIFLTNCILWGNVNSAQLWGGNTTAFNCIVEGGFVGPIVGLEDYDLTNMFSFDPLLTLLGTHGGSTPTVTLPPASPAIDAGTSTAGTPATDQRGIIRDAQPDLGATEYPIYAGAGSGGPGIAIGGSVNLPISTSLPSPTYQWYRGITGDTSNPVIGENGSSYSTPQLELGADFWVAVISGGNTMASPTISVPVRGTYQQWTTFHDLQAADSSPEACPANDGISNLVKYAAGLDPFAPMVVSNFFQISMDPPTGSMNLDLTLSRTPSDVSWDILESQDNSIWTASVGTTNPTMTSTARQTRRLVVPAISNRSFFRARFQATTP